MQSSLRVIPLGGVGETGALNCMVYETDREAIIVDCGTMFPDEATLGVDLIVPDFTYLEQISHKLRALILTHGHEDHIGATPFLLQKFRLPVYGTPFTIGLIGQKLEEYALPKAAKLNVFRPGDSLKIGGFDIETVFVNHSIIDAVALAIRVEGGFVVHLTDWKIDKTPLDGKVIDLKKFSQIGKKGVVALFSDSTNVNQRGRTLSEKEVAKKIRNICAAHKGRILITLFASNIDRIQALANIAKGLGRKLSLVGRSMRENTELARELGRLSFDGVEVIDVEETRHLKPSQVMLLVTGTQGEPRSILSRIAMDDFRPFKIQAGDLVLFSSKMIPGNEKNIYAVMDHLCRKGTKILYEGVHEIHTSGHAHQDELKEIVHLLKPAHFIPIHGSYLHLVKHAELASTWGIKKSNIFVVEDGQAVVIDRKKVSLGGIQPTGRVFVDGQGVGDVNDLVLRDRRHLAETGIVICVAMIDRKTGEIVREPELISRGFIEDETGQEMMERAKSAVMDTLGAFNLEARTDLAEVQEAVRSSLRRFFRRELDRKPMVIPVIQEV